MKLLIEGKKGIIEDNTCSHDLAFADSVTTIIDFTVTPEKVLDAAQYVIDNLVKDASSEAVE
jgi:hypothetical protein